MKLILVRTRLVFAETVTYVYSLVNICYAWPDHTKRVWPYETRDTIYASECISVMLEL